MIATLSQKADAVHTSHPTTTTTTTTTRPPSLPPSPPPRRASLPISFGLSILSTSHSTQTSLRHRCSLHWYLTPSWQSPSLWTLPRVGDAHRTSSSTRLAPPPPCPLWIVRQTQRPISRSKQMISTSTRADRQVVGTLSTVNPLYHHSLLTPRRRVNHGDPPSIPLPSVAQ